MATVPDLNSLENQDKLYFQVLINYIGRDDSGNEIVNTMVETDAFSSMKEATGIIKRLTDKFLSKVPGANLVELKPNQQTDEYYIFVVNTENNLVVAKFGIIAIDYTRATIH